MSDTGRMSSRRVSDAIAVRESFGDGTRAAGPSSSIPAEKLLRRSLRALIEAGRMHRADDGYYAADRKVRIPLDLAKKLKQRGLAVPGFSHDMVATQRGRELVKIMEANDSAIAMTAPPAAQSGDPS